MESIGEKYSNFEGSNSQSGDYLVEQFSEENSFLKNQTNKSDIKQKMHKKTEAKLSSEGRKTLCKNQMNELSLNTKKSLLKLFKEFGCSEETLQNFAATYPVNTQLAVEYYKKAAEDAQQFVYQECDSLSFNNVTEWLKYFEVNGGPKDCNYEAAIILNTIANNESHPEPKSMEGVDLKEIYNFLSMALLGLPQKQLDAESAKFLSDEFQNIIDEANTDEADIDVINMKRKIEDVLDNNCDSKISSESSSLDPLNIAKWNLNSSHK